MQESSRSHAVFTIIIEHATYDGSGGNVVTIGKLRLVDLAGSEKYVFLVGGVKGGARLKPRVRASVNST